MKTRLHSAAPDKKYVLMLGTDPSMQGGIASVIATYLEAGLENRTPLLVVPTHVTGPRLRKVRQFLWAIYQVCRLGRAGEVSVAHAHASRGASFYRKAFLLALARLFGAPTILHIHSGAISSWATKIGPLRRAFVARVFSSADRVIVLTPAWRCWLETFAPKSNITVIPNPVCQPKAAQRLPTLPNRRVLFLGTVHENKGVFDLVSAWTTFVKRFPDWKLVIGGTGDTDRLRRQAAEQHVANSVEIRGWLETDAKYEELRRADMLVLPSYTEGMPVSILEAMVHRVPVIATPVGGVPDMIPNERFGLLVPPGDAQGLAAALIRLANSPEERFRIAAEAYTKATSEYSVERILDRIVALYDALHSNGGASQ